MKFFGTLNLGLLLTISLSTIAGVDVPGFTSRRNTVVANIGDINIGYLASARRDVAGLNNQCEVDLTLTNCGLMSAMTLALDRINSDYDLLPNITIGYVAIDDCYSDFRALAASVYFVTDKSSANETSSCNINTTPKKQFRGQTNELRHYDVVGVVGPTTSSSASMAASYLSLFQIPQIGIYATSDSLSNKTKYEYFLSLVSPDSFLVRAMLDLCLHFNWTYVSFVYSAGTYGDNAASKVEYYLGTKDYASICLATKIEIPSDASRSIMNDAIKSLLLYKDARVVILFLAITQVNDFFNAAQMLVGVGQFVWLGADFLNYTTNATNLGGSLFFDHPGKEVQGLESHINSTSVGNEYLELWELANNCSFTLNVTGRRCSTTARLNKAICPVFIGEACRMYDAIFVFANAMHSVITEHCPQAFEHKSLLTNCLQGPLLLKYLRNVSINGSTGNIRFDSNGSLIENLDLKQFAWNGATKMKVATWNSSDGIINYTEQEAMNWTIFEDPPVPTNGNQSNGTIMSVCSMPCKDNQYTSLTPGNKPCCWTCGTCRKYEIVNVNRSGCQSCPTLQWPDISGTSCKQIEATYLLLSHPISICMLTLSIIGIVLTVTIIAIYIARRRHKLLRATYIPLSMVILVGSLVVSATVILYVVPPDSVPVCIARNVGFNVGINLIYGPLFVKNILIYRIFNAGARKITRSSAETQMIFTITLGIVIQLGLIVMSEYFSPSAPQQRMPSSFEEFVEQYCNKSTVWLLIPLVYNIILMFICTVVGFLTRNLPDNFNESRFIFISVATTLVAWVVFIPAYFTSYYAYLQSAFLGFCLIINCYVTLGFQFIPLIYAVLFVPAGKIKYSRTFRFESHEPCDTSSTTCSSSVSVNGSKDTSEVISEPVTTNQ